MASSFLHHVNTQFLTSLSTSALLSLSSTLHKHYVNAASTSSTQMLPSHITTLPSGRERGQYLAVDVGGTNMRVALVRLEDNEATVERLEKCLIPEAVKTGTKEEFFRWIAGHIVDLARQCTPEQGQAEWKLGVTWSFPFAQNAVNKGTIHQMGKGFNIPSILNASLTDLLHDALRTLSPPIPIRVVALLNDAVATLLSHAFIRPTTRMGIIMGTGTNATCLCPVEYLSTEKYQRGGAWEEFVVVNTEWSMFGGGVLPVTEYDKTIDRECGMPGFQPFEMMVSGRYIGEIVRLVVCDGVQNWRAFSFDDVPEQWTQKWGIQTATCSMVEAHENISQTITLLNKHFPLPHGRTFTASDAELFRNICCAVSTRSASLVAASTIAMLKVNNELCKYPGQWHSATGTPSPSDSGLGSMDEDIRWSRRGSIFSVAGSRRGSLATPSLLNVLTTPKLGTVDPRTGEIRRRSVDTRSTDSRSDCDAGMAIDLHRAEHGSTIMQEGGLVTDEPSEYASGLDDYDDDEVVVAFCGSVMEKYHRYRVRCQEILDELVKQPCPETSGRRHSATKTNGVNGVNGIHATNGLHVDEDIAPDQIVPETQREKGNAVHTDVRPAKVIDQRRVVLEENCDGGILGAGILAAVMDTKEISASFATKHQFNE